MYDRVYSINKKFFDTWGYDMAYVLGIWWADGCMHPSTCQLDIRLHADDEYLLEGIRDAMDSEHLIKPTDNASKVFRFYSKEMQDAIRKLGGTPNKSLTCILPDVPKEFFPDFVRGVFDGDGCIAMDYKQRYYISQIGSGSEKFIYPLFSRLQEEIPDLGGSIQPYDDPRNEEWATFYKMCFSKFDTGRFGTFMYSGKSSLKMTRKHDLFLKAWDIIDATKRTYMSFEDAKEYIRPFSLRCYKDWNEWSKTDRPDTIPSQPRVKYAEDWKGMPDFIGAK